MIFSSFYVIVTKNNLNKPHALHFKFLKIKKGEEKLYIKLQMKERKFLFTNFSIYS